MKISFSGYKLLEGELLPITFLKIQFCCFLDCVVIEESIACQPNTPSYVISLFSWVDFKISVFLWCAVMLRYDANKCSAKSHLVSSVCILACIIISGYFSTIFSSDIFSALFSFFSLWSYNLKLVICAHTILHISLILWLLTLFPFSLIAKETQLWR